MVTGRLSDANYNVNTSSWLGFFLYPIVISTIHLLLVVNNVEKNYYLVADEILYTPMYKSIYFGRSWKVINKRSMSSK